MDPTIDEITGKWDYSLLPSNITIGKGCFLERRESFSRFRSQKNPGLSIGNKVQVYTWTTFNVEPNGYLSIGDDTILVGAIFMCADSIVIGSRCVLSYNVTIADCDFHPLDPVLRHRDAIVNSPAGDRTQRPQLITKPVNIGNDVWVGTGAIILKGVKIGNKATIAPGTVLSHDVPEGGFASGNPATIEVRHK
jgi:acetyltransferase-like isoleucine patch superfamily enzyme